MTHLLKCLIASLAAAALAWPAAGASTPPALAQAVEATVAGKATGTVLVTQRGKVLLDRSFADRSQGGFKHSRTTIYDLASIAKTFTAVLALKLVDQGRFDMDAPLRHYLPEIPAEMTDITARRALSHSAGLPRYLEGDDLVPRTAAQALAEIAAMKRDRKTGEYYYSNLGPALVALALERAGQDTFPSLMRRLVFRPIGVRHSDFHGGPGLARRNVAPAYAGGQRKGSPADWPETWTMLGAAGIAASAEDMLRFHRSVFAGSFLSPSSRAALLASGTSTGGRASYKTPDTLDIHYGNGLFHWRDRKGRRLHFHGGASDFGSNTGLLWRQDDDVLIVALFNSATDGFKRDAFYTVILDALD